MKRLWRFGSGSHRLRSLCRLAPWASAVLVPLLYAGKLMWEAGRVSPDQVLVGLLHIDYSVYYACAREPFDSGGGLFYASPYSAAPGGRAIYSHFGFLLIGLLWQGTGWPLFAVDQILRVVCGSLMLLLAVATFQRCLPRGPLRGTVAIAGGVMLTISGGMAWLEALCNLAVAMSLRMFRELADTLKFFSLRHDFYSEFRDSESGYGEWGASLSRILTSSTECFYHVLFFACTWFVCRQQHAAAVLMLVLALWAHPFTGVELALIVAAFWTVEAARGDRRARLALGAAVGALALFLAYYLIYLPQFPEHRSVEAQMRAFSPPMMISKLLPAYGLLLPLSLVYLASAQFRSDWRSEPGVRLMTVWLAVVLGLVFHDRLPLPFCPLQPMHFTRGYLYMPLLFLAFRAIVTLRAARSRRPSHTLAVSAAALLALHLPDNLLVFLHDSPARSHHPFSVRREIADLLQALGRRPEVRSLHTIDGYGSGDLSILTPVLTHHHALLPHHFNTPFHKEKSRDMTTFGETFRLDLLHKWHIDTLIATTSTLRRIEQANPGDTFPLLATAGDMAAVAVRPSGGTPEESTRPHSGPETPARRLDATCKPLAGPGFEPLKPTLEPLAVAPGAVAVPVD